MFGQSVALYDQIYADLGQRESERVLALVGAHHPEARSLLDVACGTGRHLEALRERFECEGVDLSEEMVAYVAAHRPHLTVRRGDMMSFELGRRFDVVTCLFRSIGYARTPENLVRAIASMGRHVEPGGLLIVDPWFTPDRYWEGHVALNRSETPERKVAWMYTQRREGDLGVLDIHFLVGTAEGVEHFTERHELGLFTDAQYRDAFASAGFALLTEGSAGLEHGPYTGRRIADP